MNRPATCGISPIQIVACIGFLAEGALIADGAARHAQVGIVALGGSPGESQHGRACDVAAFKIAVIHGKHRGAANIGIAAVIIDRKAAGSGAAGGIDILIDIHGAVHRVGVAAANEAAAIQFVGATPEVDIATIRIQDTASVVGAASHQMDGARRGIQGTGRGIVKRGIKIVFTAALFQDTGVIE